MVEKAVTQKQKALRAVEPLCLLFKIERGIAQVDAGEKVTQDEARRRLQSGPFVPRIGLRTSHARAG